MEREIEAKIRDHDPDQIEELILDNWRGSEISPNDKLLMERCKNLCSLSFNGCGLKSLTNFPNLPNLIKLELSDNHIKSGFEPLSNLNELMQISLAGNQISTIEDLRPIANLPNLLSLDLYGCPVTEIDGYRDRVFEMITSLQILDGYDADGEEVDINSEDDEEDEEDEELEGFIENEESEDDFTDEEEEADKISRKRPREGGDEDALKKAARHK